MTPPSNEPQQGPGANQGANPTNTNPPQNYQPQGSYTTTTSPERDQERDR